MSGDNPGTDFWQSSKYDRQEAGYHVTRDGENDDHVKSGLYKCVINMIQGKLMWTVEGMSKKNVF